MVGDRLPTEVPSVVDSRKSEDCAGLHLVAGFICGRSSCSWLVKVCRIVSFSLCSFMYGVFKKGKKKDVLKGQLTDFTTTVTVSQAPTRQSCETEQL